MTMPLKVTPRLEERINQRWLYWHPWCLVLARKRLPHVPLERTLGQCREIHRDRYLQLVQHKVTEARIRLKGLDDPRMDMSQFRDRMQDFMKYRTTRWNYGKRADKETKNVTNK